MGLYLGFVRFIIDLSLWWQPPTTIERPKTPFNRGYQDWLCFCQKPIVATRLPVPSSSAVIVGEVNVVDLNRPGGHNGWVKGEVVITGPPPLFGLLDQTRADRVHMHVLQPLSEFLRMADEAIPELMLPP